MQAAEEATGKTAAELYKMMEQGQLLAKDFLVPFATAMRRIVRENKALQKATEKLTSQQNRMNTAYKEIVNDVFQKGGAKSIGGLFQMLTKFMEDHRETLVGLVSVVMELGVAFSKLIVTLVELSTATSVLKMMGHDGNMLVGIFWDFVAVIYKSIAGLEYMKDLLSGNWKDAKRFIAEAESLRLKTERGVFEKNVQGLLDRQQIAQNKAGVVIQKIEYTSNNSDPKQSMVEFDRYLQGELPNLLAY